MKTRTCDNDHSQPAKGNSISKRRGALIIDMPERIYICEGIQLDICGLGNYLAWHAQDIYGHPMVNRDPPCGILPVPDRLLPESTDLLCTGKLIVRLHARLYPRSRELMWRPIKPRATLRRSTVGQPLKDISIHARGLEIFNPLFRPRQTLDDKVACRKSPSLDSIQRSYSGIPSSI